MPKNNNLKKRDIQSLVMAQIKSDKVVMKPKWYFVLGSALSILGLASFGVLAIFLTNLTFFFLKSHGPNGSWRLQQILESFPLWIPFLAIISMTIGIKLLKSYDFSYQKNFKLIILGFIASIILTSLFLDYTGLSNLWTKSGRMMRYYQQNTQKTNSAQPGKGRGQYQQKKYNYQ